MQAGPGRLSNTLRRVSMMLPGAAQHERRMGFTASDVAAAAAVSDEKLLGGELVVRIEEAMVRPFILLV